jgi:hypothetical protein
MFLAEIQAKFGLDPRLKHSGVTNSGSVIIMVYRYRVACCGVIHCPVIQPKSRNDRTTAKVMSMPKVGYAVRPNPNARPGAPRV